MYALKDRCYWSDHHSEWLKEDDAVYSEYEDDYFLARDLVDALVNMNYNPEPCLKDNCLRIAGSWVHDDISYEYEKQLTLDLEDS